MAKNTREVPTAETAQTRRTVDDWAAAKGSKPYIVAAVKESMRWAVGKMVTETEYDRAMANWLNAPVDWR